MTLYADTSALARLYLRDEPDADLLADLLLHGPEAVLTSQLARLELTSALLAAGAGGRLEDARTVLGRALRDVSADGPVLPVVLDAGAVLPVAERLVAHHRLRTLDALHLAVALDEQGHAGEPLRFVTRDERQAAAARAEGLEVL